MGKFKATILLIESFRTSLNCYKILKGLKVLNSLLKTLTQKTLKNVLQNGALNLAHF